MSDSGTITAGNNKVSKEAFIADWNAFIADRIERYNSGIDLPKINDDGLMLSLASKYHTTPDLIRQMAHKLRSERHPIHLFSRRKGSAIAPLGAVHTNRQKDLILRDMKVVELRKQGLSMATIGDMFGLTRARIQQIITAHGSGLREAVREFSVLADIHAGYAELAEVYEAIRKVRENMDAV